MAKCERCSNEQVPVAEYTLEKRGHTRQVVLCKPCRDVTAQVYALEAVEAKPRRNRGSKGRRRPKKAEPPIAAVEEQPPEPEGQEPDPESEVEPSPEGTTIETVDAGFGEDSTAGSADS